MCFSFLSFSLFSTLVSLTSSEIYDLMNGTWTSGSPLPSSTQDFSFFVQGDILTAFGSDPDTVYEYDALHDTWIHLAGIAVPLGVKFDSSFMYVGEQYHVNCTKV